MKKQFLFIPLFWILLISCNNKSELKDTNIIAKFVTDSLLNGYAIDSLDIYDMDSSFLFASNHPSYIALYDELMVDIRELISKVDYYNFEKNVEGNSYPSTGHLVAFYQDAIRNKITKLNEMNKLYTPKYKGQEYGVFAKYKTDFGDSIYVTSLVVTQNKSVISGLMSPFIFSSNDKEYLNLYNNKSFQPFFDTLRINNHEKISIDTSFFIRPNLKKDDLGIDSLKSYY